MPPASAPRHRTWTSGSSAATSNKHLTWRGRRGETSPATPAASSTDKAKKPVTPLAATGRCRRRVIHRRRGRAGRRLSGIRLDRRLALQPWIDSCFDPRQHLTVGQLAQADLVDLVPASRYCHRREHPASQGVRGNRRFSRPVLAPIDEHLPATQLLAHTADHHLRVIVFDRQREFMRQVCGLARGLLPV